MGLRSEREVKEKDDEGWAGGGVLQKKWVEREKTARRSLGDDMGR